MDTYEIIDVIVNQIKDKPLWGNWYIKGDHIGFGTLSKVYRIEAQRSRRTDVSAVKIEIVTTDGKLFSDADRKRTYLESQKSKIIDNESNIMYKLRWCSNVVAYEDEDIRELYINGVFEGYYALIRMELLQSVHKLIEKNEFDFSESNVIKFAREIGYGLKAAHDAGEIHRDVKPKNLFISDKGVYKVGDFNVSKKAESSLTRGIGTKPYMAPEVHMGSNYTGQADIYSFGLCLYQMMNNNLLPFEENSSFDTAVIRRQNEKIEVPPKNASPGFGRIILKACAFDTSERYQTMDEMLNDLYNLESNDGHDRINTEDKYKTVYAGKPSANETVYAYKDDYDKKYVKDQDDFEPKRKKISFSRIIPVFFITFLFVGLGIFASIKHKDKNNDALSNQDINSSEIFIPDSMYSDERRIDTVIEEAEMLVANEDYEGALEKIKTALVTYPKSENLLSKENEYKKMLSVQIKEKILEEAEDLAKIGDYKSAIVLIKNAQDTYGDDVDYTSAYNSYCESYKAKAISAADELSNNGDYIGAIRKIDEITTIVSEDFQMAKKLQEYGEAYVSDVMVQVDALIIANDYNSAEHLLNDAVTIFPDNQLLKDEQTKLNRSAHIEYLFDTEPYLVENACLYMRNNDEDTTYSKPVSFVTDAMYYDSGWNMQSAGNTNNRLFYG